MSTTAIKSRGGFRAVQVAKTTGLRIIPRDQTPQEKLRRHAIGMLRALAEQYPKEYRDIGRELMAGVVE